MSGDKKKAAMRVDDRAYWRRNLLIIGALLAVWAIVSLGASVLFIEQLNRIKFFGVPFGFFMAQQGTIYLFVILIGIYGLLMGRLDRRHGLGNGNENGAPPPPPEAH